MPFHMHRGSLGQDGDAPLPLLIGRVHHPIDSRLVRGKDPGGAEHGVDQGGLAVVDVRDQRQIAKGDLARHRQPKPALTMISPPVTNGAST